MTSLDTLAQGQHHPAAPGILIVTGASGAGKTTLVRELESRQLDGVGCYYLDSIGVPTADEMTRRFGGPDAWQAWATQEWVSRLCENADGVTVAVLDGQVRPSLARAVLAAAGVRNAEIVLVDCAPAVRNARLRGPRGQPDLACADMDCWAAYLRGQADALDLPIVDSTESVADGVARLADRVRRLATGLAVR